MVLVVVVVVVVVFVLFVVEVEVDVAACLSKSCQRPTDRSVMRRSTAEKVAKMFFVCNMMFLFCPILMIEVLSISKLSADRLT